MRRDRPEPTPPPTSGSTPPRRPARALGRRAALSRRRRSSPSWSTGWPGCSTAWASTAEVILVDDGSRDGTLAAIARAHAADPRFVGLSLSRNFGHQVAISAGLAEARGRRGGRDGRRPPGPARGDPRPLGAAPRGYDVVYAVRASRPEGPLKRLAYAAFYRLLGRLVAIAIPLDAGRLRHHVAAGGRPDRRHARAAAVRPGAPGLGRVPPGRACRSTAGRGTRAGPSSPSRKLLGLAIDGLVGFGEAPLRPVGGLGAGRDRPGGARRGWSGWSGRPGGWGWPPGGPGSGWLVVFFGGRAVALGGDPRRICGPDPPGGQRPAPLRRPAPDRPRPGRRRGRPATPPTSPTR